MPSTKTIIPAAALVAIATTAWAGSNQPAGIWRNTLILPGEKPIVTTECRAARSLDDPAAIGLSDNPACVWQRKVAANGVLDIAGNCPGADGKRTSSTLKGRYTADSLDATMVTMLAGKPVTARLTSKRTGQCTPEE